MSCITLERLGVFVGFLEIIEGIFGVLLGCLIVHDTWLMNYDNAYGIDKWYFVFLNSMVALFMMVWILQIVVATLLIQAIRKKSNAPMKMWMILKTVILTVVILSVAASLMHTSTLTPVEIISVMFILSINICYVVIIRSLRDKTEPNDYMQIQPKEPNTC